MAVDKLEFSPRRLAISSEYLASESILDIEMLVYSFSTAFKALTLEVLLLH
jgi:hypothetical protein